MSAGPAERSHRGDPSPDAPVPTEATAPTATNVIGAPRDEVFEILVDPATYPEWLVGASRIRSIDADWPAVGSSFRHYIGWGPLRMPGSTSVRHCTPPFELVLSAGMGPLGEASVRFELESAEGGTLVRFEELPSKGPARLAWLVARPLVALGLWGRNAVSIDALAEFVGRRRAP